MLTAHQFTEQQQQEYRDFVAAHQSGSFLQSWAWGEFQQSAFGKTAIRYGVWQNNSLIATVQFLHTKVPGLPGSYLYAAYGPLVASALHDEMITHTLTALIDQIKKDFPNIWFVRFEPKDELPITGTPSQHIQPGSTLVVDLSQSEEELLAHTHKKTRYNIKMALKHHVTVRHSEIIDENALQLLINTSDRQGYKSHPASYYRALLSHLQKPRTAADCTAHLYQAVYEDKCVASAIMIDHGNTRTYLFGGSDTTYKHVMAPSALHWQAIRDAKNAGKTQYDWWGVETASGATPGFVQFKLRWGGTRKSYADARDIVLNTKWYFVYSQLRKINRLR